MRIWLVIVLLLLGALPARSLTITDDVGGFLSIYQYRIENTTDEVRIEGECDSACTMYLSLPYKQVCVTPTAQLGFHSSSKWRFHDDDPPIYLGPSREGTALMWHSYPLALRGWLFRRGGLVPKVKYLSGAELIKLGIRACT